MKCKESTTATRFEKALSKCVTDKNKESVAHNGELIKVYTKRLLKKADRRLCAGLRINCTFSKRIFELLKWCYKTRSNVPFGRQ